MVICEGKNTSVVVRANDCENENCLAVIRTSSCIESLNKSLTVVSRFLLNPRPRAIFVGFHRELNNSFNFIVIARYLLLNRVSTLLISVMSEGTSTRYVLYIFTPCKRKKKKKRTMRARSIDARTHKHDYNNCMIIARNDTPPSRCVTRGKSDHISIRRIRGVRIQVTLS